MCATQVRHYSKCPSRWNWKGRTSGGSGSAHLSGRYATIFYHVGLCLYVHFTSIECLRGIVCLKSICFRGLVLSFVSSQKLRSNSRRKKTPRPAKSGHGNEEGIHSVWTTQSGLDTDGKQSALVRLWRQLDLTLWTKPIALTGLNGSGTGYLNWGSVGNLLLASLIAMQFYSHHYRKQPRSNLAISSFGAIDLTSRRERKQ